VALRQLRANVISVFDIDLIGKLDPKGWVDTRGKIPRGMNIDPSGTFLYVGNQDTDTIAVFGINRGNGRLNGPLMVNSPTPVDFEFGPPA
jgi:6-phosphogluconolactonase